MQNFKSKLKHILVSTLKKLLKLFLLIGKKHKINIIEKNLSHFLENV